MSQTPPKPNKVYFFGTCIINAVYPSAGLAGIRLLKREGITVVYPPNQSCCGQPAFNSGFPEEAKEVARMQLKQFPKDYPIVVPSGSCAGMMKVHYPELFKDDPEFELAVAFSKRIFELTEFLVTVLDISLEDQGHHLNVTWHSSCHATREMNIIGHSKALLKQLKNVNLVELENEHQCCGFGGTFSVKQPEISAAMVNDKVDDILGTGAKQLLSGDCGCLANINGAIDYRNLSVNGKHIAEFIWERTNGTK